MIGVKDPLQDGSVQPELLSRFQLFTALLICKEGAISIAN